MKWIKTSGGDGEYVNLDLAYHVFISESENEECGDAEWEVMAEFIAPTGNYETEEEDSETPKFSLGSETFTLETFETKKDAQAFLDSLFR